MVLEERDVIQALRRFYALPEWVFVNHIRTTTGAMNVAKTFNRGLDANRLIDGMALNCYPSRGFERITFEVKVSTSDLISELRNPVKFTKAYHLGHKFYFVLSPDVLNDEATRLLERELRGPGVIEVNEDLTLKFHSKIKALPHEALPMSEGFMLSILRKMATEATNARQLLSNLNPEL
jgi:hypothetical protein